MFTVCNTLSPRHWSSCGHTPCPAVTVPSQTVPSASRPLSSVPRVLTNLWNLPGASTSCYRGKLTQGSPGLLRSTLQDLLPGLMLGNWWEGSSQEPVMRCLSLWEVEQGSSARMEECRLTCCCEEVLVQSVPLRDYRVLWLFACFIRAEPTSVVWRCYSGKLLIPNRAVRN